MKISTAIRRMCHQCAAYTDSVMCSNGHYPEEICADHPCPYCGDDDW